MRSPRICGITALALLCIAGRALATTHGEQGDALDVPPGQATMGPGPLLRIHGVLGDSVDVDMYCIRVVDPANFSATVVSATGFDTQLFLFAGPGACSPTVCPPVGGGVVHDDDTPPGGIQSALTPALVTNPAPYYLAISGYDRDPTEVGGQLIWNNDPANAERPPDGPGALGLCSGWTGYSDTVGEYWIVLTGCEACDPSPEPQVWDELADAPQTIPGQFTSGAGAMIGIFGELSDVNDVDLYCINVTDPASFTATTSGAPANDTELSLFSASGNGVTFNDDGGNGLSSRLTGAFLLGPGTYYLAVSDFERTATGPGGGTIWDRIPNIDERQPDGTEPNGQLSGWIGAGASSGFYGVSLTGATFCSNVTDVPGGTPPTAGLRLDARPTPFASATIITYSLPKPGAVRIWVFDIGGRLVRTLVHESQPAGEHSVRWDGRDEKGVRVHAGLYSVQLEATGSAASQGMRKIVLMR